MESFRILMTSTFYPPFHFGGDAVHVKLLKEELERRGHEVHVIYSLDAFSLKGGTITGNDEVSPTVHPVEGRGGKWSAAGAYLTGRSRAAERELERLIKEIRPDWIHHHNVSLLGVGVLRDRDLPSIYTAHDYWLICPRSDLMYLGKTPCHRRRCTYCSLATRRPPQLWRSGFEPHLNELDAFISPSRFMASSLSSFLDLSSNVIPNFQAPPPPSSTEPLNKDRFVFVGVLEKHKGVDLLLRAFERGNIHSPLSVMGKGSLEPEVREASELHPDRITYLGYAHDEERRTEISSAIAMVAPSVGNENAPLSCIEALSLGIPLVVSGNGGLPELVEDPECGLVCEATVDGLERTLLRLEADPELRRRLSSNAKARYRQHHTPERYLQDYLALSNKVMD